MKDELINIKEKDILFLAYSNSKNDSLHFLEEEYNLTKEILESEDVSDVLEIYSHLGVDREYMIDFLINYRERIVVFQYSGHASKDSLILENDLTNSRGILKLLTQCPKLKLIILNGCSTKSQVKAIAEEVKNIPIIISTNTKVGDQSASEYAKAFWRSFFSNEQTVEVAHNAGIGAATSIRDEIRETRNAAFDEANETNDEQPFWDISYQDQIAPEWILAKELPDDLAVPNKILRERLIEAFSYQNEEFNTIIQEVPLSEKEVRETKILEALPLPISDQLRKLFAKKSNRKVDEDHEFYNQYDSLRLKQLVKTSKTLIETITFVHLAQIWEIYDNTNDEEDQMLLHLKQFFQLKKQEKQSFSLINLCYDINKYFERNGKSNFLKEWETSDLPLKEDQFFNEAVEFIQQIGNNLGKDVTTKVIEYCLEGERYLATIFSKLAFIINYRMVSIQGIDVKKYRHAPENSYYHNVVKLTSKFGAHTNELKVKQEETTDPRFNDSVFIERKSDGEYLNLTPFIIDQNSFKATPHLAKICHFDLFDETQNDNPSYIFKHVYETKKEKLFLVKEKNEYNNINAQLNLFKTSVLNLNDNAL